MSSSKAAVDMLVRVLAVEEPAVTTLAMRPGIVETDMLALLMSSEAETILAADQTEYLKHSTRLQPRQPASVIADLVLNAPRELSGSKADYDSIAQH